MALAILPLNAARVKSGDVPIRNFLEDITFPIHSVTVELSGRDFFKRSHIWASGFGDLRFLSGRIAEYIAGFPEVDVTITVRDHQG